MDVNAELRAKYGAISQAATPLHEGILAAAKGGPWPQPPLDILKQAAADIFQGALDIEDLADSKNLDPRTVATIAAAIRDASDLLSGLHVAALAGALRIE